MQRLVAASAAAVLWAGVLVGCQDLGVDRVKWACSTHESCGAGWMCGSEGFCLPDGTREPASDVAAGDALVSDAPSVCKPACGGKACGPDGCGGICGTCPAATPVCEAGACVCEPACGGKACGPDGCGGFCGTCSGGKTCSAGACVSAEVLVPAGSFWMGCNAAKDTQCDSDEKPQHEVWVDVFYIDRTEVTIAAYTGSGSDQRPQVDVNWTEARDHCTGQGKRLCTEAEWEKAARGGCETVAGDCQTGMRTYPWGEAAPTCDLAWFSGCPGDAQAVGLLAAGASPFGALDMAGNVWEWVQDCYHSNYTGAPATGYPPWQEGSNASDCSSSFRVVRGGCFAGFAALVRASLRGVDTPSYADYYLGFRCCRTPASD